MQRSVEKKISLRLAALSTQKILLAREQVLKTLSALTRKSKVGGKFELTSSSSGATAGSTRA
jgi:hypothetical protein